MIPLTVIGGFLGAGKTTLVNHILRTATRRYAVLVNDFGAINIDAALITAQDGTTIALANGCVCCALGDDFGAALENFSRRNPPPEHVIVEASGVSDPWRIAQLALIEPGFDLEPLVVLADASALPAQLDDRWIADTVQRQLTYAELVVLNKCDLADPAPAEAAIRRLRPEARVLRTTDARIDPDALRFALPPRPRPSRLVSEAPHDFSSRTWPCPGPLDRDKLRTALENLPRSVLRLKGFIQLGPAGEPNLLQYAAERWAFSKCDAASAVLVAIGTPDLPPAEELFAPFAAAVLSPEAAR